MKKLLLLIPCIFFVAAECTYTVKLQNTTNGRVAVKMNIWGWYDDNFEMDSGETKIYHTPAAYCVRAVEVIGLTGDVQGLANSGSPGSDVIGRCRNFQVYIGYVGPSTGAGSQAGAATGGSVQQQSVNVYGTAPQARNNDWLRVIVR